MITCLNLFSGCMACVMALSDNNYIEAFIFIIIASVFDFFDGFAARLLKVYSDIGKELDSLADVVSFGVAPGMVIYVFLQDILANAFPSSLAYFSLFAFLIPAFSALRLAKFNIDDRQTSSFIGLPVPANALFWGSFIYLLSYSDIIPPLYKIVGVILCIFLFSYLMVSEIQMFSLKFKNYRWKRNEMRYILIVTSIVLLIVFNLSGISVIIIAYMFMSLFKSKASL